MSILLMAAMEGLPVQPADAQAVAVPVLASGAVYAPAFAVVPRVRRNKTQLVALVKTAPTGAQDRDWWLAWLKAHW